MIQPGDTDEISPIRFGILAAVGVTMLSQLGALMIVKVAGIESGTAVFLLVIAATQLGLLLLPTLYLSGMQSLPQRTLLRLNPAHPMFYLAIVVGIIALWPMIQAWQLVQELYLIPSDFMHYYLKLERATQQAIGRLFYSNTISGLLLVLLVGGVTTAVGEEVLFRGLVQRSFERRMKPIWAITLAGMFFATMHFQPVAFVGLAGLGMFFGYVVYRSNSILPAMVGHFLFNAVSLVGLYAVGPDAASDIPIHTTNELVTLLPIALGSLIVFVVVVRWLGKQLIINNEQ